MVAQIRTTADAIETLREIEEKPYQYDFFSLLRYLECLHTDKPRFGEAARPVDEPVRLTQEPSLAFAPSTVATFKAGDDSHPHKLSTYFFGMFGPQGPLPLHLTEYIKDREHNSNDPTLRRFVDIFHHRLTMLFYRAWANASPATSLDRASPRRFDTYVGSFFGIGMEELRGRDAVPDEAKLHLAGLLGLKTRPANGLLAMLTEFMELPFQLQQFKGEWMSLAPEDWSRLGARHGGAKLGIDMMMGSKVWNCQHRFRLICGPIGAESFKRLLPGRDSLARLRDLIRNYLGDEFDWDLNLVLFAEEVPDLRLGVSGELGWTSWLGQRQTDEDADEVVVHPMAALH